MTDERDLTAADLRWEPEPAPWDAPQIELALVLDALALADHPMVRAAVEQLASALVARDEQLRATRMVLSVTLTFLCDVDRRQQALERQLHEMRAARRVDDGTPPTARSTT